MIRTIMVQEIIKLLTKVFSNVLIISLKKTLIECGFPDDVLNDCNQDELMELYRDIYGDNN